MRKVVLMIFAVLIIAALSVTFFACSEERDIPEGGSWKVLSDNKVWSVKTLELSFEADGYFRVRDGEDVWIEGKYSFAGTPGQSTLTLSEADIAIPGVETDGAKEYEPVDGVYKIEFDHGMGQTSTYSFKPPQDGTLPGEETSAPEQGGEQGNEPAPAEPMVILTATGQQIGAAQIKLYADGKFDFVVESAGGRVFGGTWASSDDTNQTAPLTLTVDETGSSAVGETITVNIDASTYPDITYTGTVTYKASVSGYEINDTLSFSGTLSTVQMQ